MKMELIGPVRICRGGRNGMRVNCSIREADPALAGGSEPDHFRKIKSKSTGNHPDLDCTHTFT